jgi:hypothetical protein
MFLPDFGQKKRQHFYGVFGCSKLNKSFVFSEHVSNGQENEVKRKDIFAPDFSLKKSHRPLQ